MGSRERRRVLLTDDHVSFAEHAAERLRADPVGTSVVATVLAGVRAGRPQPPGSLWVVVLDGDRPVGVALCTAGFAPFVTPMDDDDAAALADTLHRAGHDLAQVRGDAAATRAFAVRWEQLTGCPARRTTDEGVHLLTTLVAPSGVAGTARAATPADAPLVAAWHEAFEREAHVGEQVGAEELAQHAAMFVRRVPSGQVVLWTDGDGTPVSLAGWQLPDAEPGEATARIGPVYTPPAARRHGYAAAVTAAATRGALAAGAARVMLYTDLANPTSNGVYARLGYRKVADGSTWTFSPPERRPS